MTAKLTSVPAALYIVDLIREDIFKRFDCTLWTDGIAESCQGGPQKKDWQILRGIDR